MTYSFSFLYYAHNTHICRNYLVFIIEPREMTIKAEMKLYRNPEIDVLQ